MTKVMITVTFLSDKSKYNVPWLLPRSANSQAPQGQTNPRTKEKFLKKTSFQLSAGPKNGQKQGRDEKTEEHYATTELVSQARLWVESGLRD